MKFEKEKNKIIASDLRCDVSQIYDKQLDAIVIVDALLIQECSISVETFNERYTGVKITKKRLKDLFFTENDGYFNYLNFLSLRHLTTDDFYQTEVKTSISKWNIYNLMYIHELQNLVFTLYYIVLKLETSIPQNNENGTFKWNDDYHLKFLFKKTTPTTQMFGTSEIPINILSNDGEFTIYDKSDIKKILQLNYTEFNFEVYDLLRSDINYYIPKKYFQGNFFENEEFKMLKQYLINKYPLFADKNMENVEILFPQDLVNSYFENKFKQSVSEILDLKRKAVISLYEKWIPISRLNDFTNDDASNQFHDEWKVIDKNFQNTLYNVFFVVLSRSFVDNKYRDKYLHEAEEILETFKNNSYSDAISKSLRVIYDGVPTYD